MLASGSQTPLLHMDGRLLALLASFFFGVVPVMLSVALKQASAEVAVLATLVVGLPLLLLLSPFLGGLHLLGLSPGTVLLFALGGLLGPLLGRSFLYKGIEGLGSSRAVAINNAAPLITGAAAVLLLAEPLGAIQWLAIVLIVAGLAAVSHRSGTALPQLRPSGLAFAGLSAVAFGLRPVVFKLGLRQSTDPMTASVIASATALLGFLLYLTVTGRSRSIRLERRSVLLFAAVSVIHTLGFLSLNFAVNVADVGQVYPISATSPLVTFLLSYFLLRNMERLSFSDLAATLAIVAGVMLLSA